MIRLGAACRDKIGSQGRAERNPPPPPPSPAKEPPGGGGSGEEGGGSPADDPEASLPLHGPNQWPSESLLPGFKAAVTAYFDALTELGHKLLRLLALSLKLPGVCVR